jgi:hypothetical protein
LAYKKPAAIGVSRSRRDRREFKIQSRICREAQEVIHWKDGNPINERVQVIDHNALAIEKATGRPQDSATTKER